VCSLSSASKACATFTLQQPFHVSFQDDRGGNEVGVSGGLCSGDLRAVWTAASSRKACPETHTRSHETFSTRSPRTTGRHGGPPTRPTSPSRSRLARRPGTASAPRPGAGMTPRTSPGRGRAGKGDRRRPVLHRDAHADRQGPLGQGRRPARRPSGLGAPRLTIWGALARDRPRYSGGHYPATERQAATDTRRSGEPTRKPGRRVEDGQLLPRA
jgi:hypothetical protein